MQNLHMDPLSKPVDR